MIDDQKSTLVAVARVVGTYLASIWTWTIPRALKLTENWNKNAIQFNLYTNGPSRLGERLDVLDLCSLLHLRSGVFFFRFFSASNLLAFWTLCACASNAINKIWGRRNRSIILNLFRLVLVSRAQKQSEKTNRRATKWRRTAVPQTQPSTFWRFGCFFLLRFFFLVPKWKNKIRRNGNADQREKLHGSLNYLFLMRKTRNGDSSGTHRLNENECNSPTHKQSWFRETHAPNAQCPRERETNLRLY